VVADPRRLAGPVDPARRHRWIAGRAIRERDLVAARLAERAEELEREREAFASLSVRYERARIASELHDIVAHAISVMVVQAGAGQRIAAVDPS
jgi:signal transduction histidine kinase